MPPRRKLIPPLRPNADGTGFVRVDAKATGTARGNLGQRDADTGAASEGARRGRTHAHGEPKTGENRLGRAASSSSSSVSSASLSTSSSASAGRAQPVPRRAAGTSTQKPAAAALPVMGKAPPPQASQTSAPKSVYKSASQEAVPVVLTVDTALPSNECRVSPSLLRRLGVGSGAVLEVSCALDAGTRGKAYLEAFLSTSCSADALAVSPETKSVLLSVWECEGTAAVTKESRQQSSRSPQVYVVPVQMVSLPRARSVSISVFVDSDSTLVAAVAGDSEGVPTGDECLQWRVLFRHAFRNRVVFTGMRATLRSPSAHAVVCEVVDMTLLAASRDGAEHLPPFGVLGGNADVAITRRAGGEGQSGNSPVPLSAQEAVSLATNPSAHVLVLGDPGTGKTYRLRQEVAELESRGGQNVLVLRVEDLPQGEGSEVATATAVREALAAAAAAAPSTIVMDDLHLICGSHASAAASSVGSAWAVALVVASLCEALREVAVHRMPVRLVASAPSRETLDESLLVPDRLGGCIRQLSPPASAEEREQCLLACLQSVRYTDVPRDAVRDVALHGHGYTQRDLHRVVEAAMMLSLRKRGTTFLNGDDLVHAAKLVHPSSLRQFEVAVPDVTWDDIGGSDVAKRTLQEMVEWCLGKQSWVFSEFHLSPPKGVLLYGPPGCSKTMLAKALANESRMNFVSVKGPEVFSKWVGDSEKAVRDIFSRARAAAPCVVFIDELDGMCGHRGRGGVSDRVISQFLTELDGLPSAMQQEEASKGKQSSALVFVAATNRPDNIDGAVLRPGRIDRRVHVGLPELAEREAIARIQFRRLPTHPDLTAAFVAERTAGYTGAEVVAVVKEAAFTAISNDMAASCVTRDDVEQALRKVRPRVDQKDVEWYKNWPHNASGSTRSA